MRKHIISAFLLMQMFAPAYAQAFIQYEDQKFKASDARYYSFFGVSMDIDQNTLVVGAMFHTHSGETDAGAAYLFEKNDENQWQETAYLTASDAVGGDKFGRSTAIFGNTILIGSPFSQTTTSENHGKAYVFQQIDNNWIESQVVEYTGDQLFPLFGNEVEMNEQFLFISAPSENNGFGTNQGTVYVYEKTNGMWNFSQKLTNSLSSSSGSFGDFLIATDDRLVVTSYLEETDDGTQRGASYIYSLNGQNNWQLEQRLSPESNSDTYSFGAIATNLDTILVRSQTGNTQPNVTRQLEVYKKVDGIWQVNGSISPPDNGLEQFFAVRAKLNGDKLMVSSVIDPAKGPEYYVIYYYEYHNEQWQYKNTLIPSDPTTDSGFGFDFTMSNTDALVGSYLDDTIAEDSGAVYSYDLDSIFSNGFDSVEQPIK